MMTCYSKTPFTRYPVCDSAGKKSLRFQLFTCTIPVELYRVLVLRSHEGRINVEFEFVCFSYLKCKPLLLTIFIHTVHSKKRTTCSVMAKGDGREVGFQDGGYFSTFLKRERINNQTFIAFLNCG